MIIGRFTYNTASDTYEGQIRTLSLHHVGVTLRPNNSPGERDPNYRVTLETETSTVELGAAWRKTSGRGQNYLSVVIDDPGLPVRCDAALFPGTREGEAASLVWTRPPVRRPLTPAAQAPESATRPARRARNARAAPGSPQA